MMRILKNLVYDIKAIKKYGLITHFKYLFDYKHVIINLHTHLDYVPQFVDRPEFVIKEVNLNDKIILKQWVDIVNDAYGFDKPFTINSAKKYMENHLYKIFEHTYFVYFDSRPVGTYSIGRFKVNERIGTTGRFAVLKDYQNKGLGRYLVLYGFRKLKEKGYKNLESVFVVSKDYSIRIYLRCGAIPQFKKKYLQFKPTPKFILVRLWAQYRVKKMYRKFREELDKNYIA